MQTSRDEGFLRINTLSYMSILDSSQDMKTSSRDLGFQNFKFAEGFIDMILIPPLALNPFVHLCFSLCRNREDFVFKIWPSFVFFRPKMRTRGGMVLHFTINILLILEMMQTEMVIIGLVQCRFFFKVIYVNFVNTAHDGRPTTNNAWRRTKADCISSPEWLGWLREYNT